MALLGNKMIISLMFFIFPWIYWDSKVAFPSLISWCRLGPKLWKQWTQWTFSLPDVGHYRLCLT